MDACESTARASAGTSNRRFVPAATSQAARTAADGDCEMHDDRPPPPMRAGELDGIRGAIRRLRVPNRSRLRRRNRRLVRRGLWALVRACDRL